MATERILGAAIAAVALGALPGGAVADTMKLDTITVTTPGAHPSQTIRNRVDEASDKSRTASYTDGEDLRDVNPVNKLDALRFGTTGLVNQPGAGNRFGGNTKIRTFGDWGAANSIDGLPAFKSAGEEGGGFGSTNIPTIAIDRIGVLKGGRAVEFGDGSDGGVVNTTLKSGRDYKDHQALQLDFSSAREGQVQAEAADSGQAWDYYVAGSAFYGLYNGEPENLQDQGIFGGLGKVGWNPADWARAEFTLIYDRSEPDIYRNGEHNEIETESIYGAATLDMRLSDINSVRVGYLGTDSNSLWPARSRDRSIVNHIAFADHYVSYDISSRLRYDGSVGVEYKHTNYLRDNQWDNDFNDVSLKSRNALTLDDNLVVSAGLRHTWFDNEIVLNGQEQPDNLRDDTVLAHDLGISYSVLENTRLRASWATGYNRFFEKYGNFGTDPLDLNGAGDEIVESETVEVGINQGWKGGSIDIALWNIVQDGVPRRSNGMIESVEVDQWGLEVEIASRITDRLHASAGYTHIFDVEATRADGTDANGNIFFGGNGVSVPEHQVYTRLDYLVTDDVNLWGAAYYSSGYEAVNFDGSVTERDEFVRLDLGAGWQATPQWQLRFHVENVTDERDFGRTVAGVPADEGGELGRVYWLGANVTF